MTALGPQGESQTLVMSRSRMARLLLIGIAFTAMGVLELSQGHRIIGTIAVGFFGLLCIPAIAAQALWPSRLSLDRDTFTVQTPWRRKPLVRRWTDVGPFSVWMYARSSTVVYSTLLTDKALLRSANRSLAGHDESIPSGYGGLSADVLAELLNRYRDDAVGSA